MKRKSFTTLSFFIVLAAAQLGQAQEVWSLQRCIGHALDQSLTIKQSLATVQTAQLGEKQARASRLPNLGLGSNVGAQNGFTIDPVTNAPKEGIIWTNSINLNAGITLYNGSQIKNSIMQGRINADAAGADLEQASNNLALQVATAYLNVLLNIEQVANAKSQLGLSQKQLANTQKLVDAGNLPIVDRYNVEAQIARDEQNVVTTENNVELAYLSLKQLMQMEPDTPMAVEQPNIDEKAIEDYTVFNLKGVYNIAQGTQPSLKASGRRVEAAQYGIKIAKAGYLPTVSAFANLNGFFSSQNTEFTPDGTRVLAGTRPVSIDGGLTILPLSEYSFNGSIDKIPYFSQLEQTFGQSIGLSLNVPIYQNGQVRLSVERAKLNLLNAELQKNQVEQQLKNDIQTALANLKGAKKQLDAAQKTYDAANLAYVNTEKRQAIGAANSLEFNTSKNNLDVALNNRTVARYNYIFRAKILEFYLGKPLMIEQK